MRFYERAIKKIKTSQTTQKRPVGLNKETNKQKDKKLESQPCKWRVNEAAALHKQAGDGVQKV